MTLCFSFPLTPFLDSLFIHAPKVLCINTIMGIDHRLRKLCPGERCHMPLYHIGGTAPQIGATQRLPTRREAELPAETAPQIGATQSEWQCLPLQIGDAHREVHQPCDCPAEPVKEVLPLCDCHHAPAKKNYDYSSLWEWGHSWK